MIIARAMCQGDESWAAPSDAVANLVGILIETTTQTYRAIHVEGARRVALAAQRNAVMRLTIGQGFGSPDNDQKQANCKERPSPQQIEIYPVSPEEAQSHPLIDEKRDQTCHDQCCQRMHTDGHEGHQQRPLADYWAARA